MSGNWYSATYMSIEAQCAFTISDVAADWYEVMHYVAIHCLQ